MRRIVNGVPVTEGSSNVYADLGFPDAQEMLEKAELTSQLEGRLAELGMTHAQAAELFNVSVPWLRSCCVDNFGRSTGMRSLPV